MKIVLICSVAAAVILLIFLILDSRKNKRRQKLEKAARQLIRGRKLDMAIHRAKGDHTIPLRKQMLEITIHNPQKRYVFDPDQDIFFGRVERDNNIIIHDMKVSSRHCVIRTRDGLICLEDLNSINGTWIRRGLRKIQVIYETPLRSGDVLLIGGAQIELYFFWIDTTFI